MISGIILGLCDIAIAFIDFKRGSYGLGIMCLTLGAIILIREGKKLYEKRRRNRRTYTEATDLSWYQSSRISRPYRDTTSKRKYVDTRDSYAKTKIYK